MADNRQRGLIQVAADLQQQGRAGMSGGAALPDNGAGQAFGSVAGEIEQIGKKIGQWADHAAQVEGARAGALAGLDPEFRPGRSLTIRGEAFDKAGLGVMQAKLKQGIAADFEGIADKHGNDPAKLRVEIDKKRQQWTGNLPDEIKAEVTLFISGQTSTAIRQASRAQRAAFVAEQSAQAHAEFATEMKAAQQKAYQLGLDPEADAALTQSHGAVSRLLHRKGADGRPLFSPTERVKTLERLKEKMAEARVVGAFDRMTSVDDKQRALDGLRRDYMTNDRGIAKVLSRDGFERLENRLERDLAQDNVRADRQSRALHQQVDTVMKLAEKGHAPSQQDMAAMETAVNASRSPQLINEWADASSVFGWMSRAATMPPERVDGALRALREDMRANGATPRKLKLAEKTEALLGNMRTALKTDPLGWAGNAGIDVPALDLADAPKFTASLTQRVAAADAIGAQFAVTPRYFRPDEAKALASRMSEGGAQMLEIAAAIAATSPARAPKILAELAEHGPAVATIGAVAANGTAPGARFATDAANGLAMMRLDGFKARVQAQRVTEAADEELGSAFAAAPAQRQALITAVNAAYEARALRGQKTEFDKETWKLALREAVGEHVVGGVTYGGIARGSMFGRHDPVVVPANIKRDNFRQVIEAIRVSDLIDPMGQRPIDAKGRDIDEASIRRARLVQAGPGRYLMALGNDPDDPQFIGGGKGPGGAFVLDLTRLSSILRKRRPDLFLEGK